MRKIVVFKGLIVCNTINLNKSDIQMVKEIQQGPPTRYIYIQNINNPVKIFKETAV